MSRKPKRPITDHERISLALERFTPANGRFPSFDRLAVEHDRSKGVISRAVKEAFTRNLVEIRPVARPSVPVARNRNLETRLLDRFDQLRDAIVIDREEQRGARSDDDLHQQISRETARFIAGSHVWDDGDAICLGGGRGVFYTVDALAGFPPLRLSDVELVSLSGRAGARDYSDRINVDLDAESSVFVLARRFERRAELHYAYWRVAYDNEEQRNRARAETSLAQERWDSMNPKKALVGVGVLSSGHSFFRHSGDGGVNEFLTPIGKELEELRELYERASTDRYCPVADICNRLFFVPPPAGERIPKQIEDRIRALIRQIENRLLSVTPEQLQQAQKIILVAGTRKKAPAIRHLLGVFNNIRVLATDRGSAREILSG